MKKWFENPFTEIPDKIDLDLYYTKVDINALLAAISETDPLSWLKATAQTGLTGDKTGTFNLTTTGTGTFGSTYQAVLGDDAGTRAGYFIDGTNSLDILYGGYVVAAYAATGTAGIFYDAIGNQVNLIDGTYAINAVGTIAGLAAMTTNTPSILFFPTFTYSAADDYLAPFSFYAGDYRTTTGASANFNVFTINSDKNGAYSATNDSLTALSMAVNDGGTYNTGTSSIESISFSLGTYLFPIIDVGAGNTVTHNAYGSQIYVGVTPTISSGTYVGNYYGHFIDVVGATGGTTTAYGVYINSVGGTDTNWGFYNKTSVNNQFSIAGSKSGFGLANGTVPTAKIHIGAGTATAGSAPIKFTSGPLTTAAVAGQVEYLSGLFYIRGTEGWAFGAATEYINSANAGYLDLNAATGIRLNKDTVITGNCKATTYNVGADAGVDIASGTIKGMVVKKGIVTAGTSVTPAADGTYALPTSITISGGIITAIS